MYRPRAFAVDDRPALHEVIRNRVFATFALVHEGRVQFAYAPVVVDADANEIRFHLAKANPVAALADGARVAVSFAGPDAYVSPDWYETGGLVPTWNYIAVEGEGIARTLTRDELLALLGDLSAQEEKTLFRKRHGRSKSSALRGSTPCSMPSRVLRSASNGSKANSS
jgi:transcriptional regulator